LILPGFYLDVDAYHPRDLSKQTYGTSLRDESNIIFHTATPMKSIFNNDSSLFCFDNIGPSLRRISQIESKKKMALSMKTTKVEAPIDPVNY